MTDEGPDRINTEREGVTRNRRVRSARPPCGERQGGRPDERGRDERATKSDHNRMVHSRAMSSEAAPTGGQLVGVALVSATLLVTELCLTRIFSVVMYYHFAFLAISIALFGLSASGVFAFVARRTLDRQP